MNRSRPVKGIMVDLYRLFLRATPTAHAQQLHFLDDNDGNDTTNRRLSSFIAFDSFFFGNEGAGTVAPNPYFPLMSAYAASQRFNSWPLDTLVVGEVGDEDLEFAGRVDLGRDGAGTIDPNPYWLLSWAYA